MYQGNPFLDPLNWFGFVYQIENVESGRRYIGEKQFVSKRTKPPLKGQKRKRRTTVESDWKSYYGSCDELLAEIAQHGPERFERTILKVCSTKRELTYGELEAQVKADVLTAMLPDGTPAYYNSNIAGRFFRH